MIFIKIVKSMEGSAANDLIWDSLCQFLIVTRGLQCKRVAHGKQWAFFCAWTISLKYFCFASYKTASWPQPWVKEHTHGLCVCSCWRLSKWRFPNLEVCDSLVSTNSPCSFIICNRSFLSRFKRTQPQSRSLGWTCVRRLFIRSYLTI